MKSDRFHGKRMRAWFFCFVAVLQHLVAQVPSSGEVSQPQKNVAELSIIGVGPVAPRRFRASNEQDVPAEQKALLPAGSVPMLLPPLPGEVPPSSLTYQEGAKEESIRSVPVGFNRFSPGVEVPAVVPIALRRAKGKDGADKHYMTCPALSAGGRYVLLLAPSGKGPTKWETEPRSFLIRVDGEHFVPDQILALNVSSHSVNFLFGQDKAVLLPQVRKSFSMSGASGLLRCAAQVANESSFVMNKAVPAGKGARLLYVFYDVDPQTNGGKRVAVCTVDLPAASTP